MTQDEIFFVITLYIPTIISCLFFLFKLIKTIINIIRHFKCKKKYKNLIQIHEDMCKRCAENINNDRDLYKRTLNKFIQNLYIGEI